MTDDTLTVCYIDSDGKYSCCVCRSDMYMTGSIFDKKRFEADNPNVHVTSVFNSHDNIIMLNEKEKNDFITLCSLYDFEPSDYKRLIVDSNYEHYLLCGFITRNRKYEAKLLRLKDNRYIKSTIAFVRKYII